MTSVSEQKSTIVRSIVHGAFGAMERVAPAVGASIVNRLWFRLPAASPSTESPTGTNGPSGVPFEVALRGRRIRGWSWGEGPTVYLVHGWAGSVEQLGAFVAPLVAGGFRVVGFDGLSHGRSEAGENGAGSTDAVELGRGIDAVFARFGPAHAVVTHSMGALSTLLALRDGWIGTERLALLAPVTGVPDFVRVMRARLGFGDRTQRRLESLAERRTGYAVSDLDVARLASQISRPKLLVVHDEDDRQTPWAGSTALVGRWPGAQLHTTRGLGHRRILSDPDVVDRVARFVADAPLDAAPDGHLPAPSAVA